MHGKSFMERFRSKPENAAKAAATKAKAKPKSRIERSEDDYVKLHRTQITKLWELRGDPAACTLFVVLLGESRARYGKPFELPAAQLHQISGLGNATRLRTKLRKLEQEGLLVLEERAPRPMLVQVPLAL